MIHTVDSTYFPINYFVVFPLEQTWMSCCLFFSDAIHLLVKLETIIIAALKPNVGRRGKSSSYLTATETQHTSTVLRKQCFGMEQVK